MGSVQPDRAWSGLSPTIAPRSSDHLSSIWRWLAAFQNNGKIEQQAGQGCVEQGGLGDDHQIEGTIRLVNYSKDFSNQSFSAISHDRTAELPGRNDAKASPWSPVRRSDDREVSAMGSASGVEDALKFHPPAQASNRWQSMGLHAG